MDRDAVLATEYLLGPGDPLSGIGPLWYWADHERVITWPDGTTIAFREELAQVLEPLVPGGLPPLLSVLVLLSATRNNWPEEAEKLIGSAGWLCRTAASIDTQPFRFPADILVALNRVHALPAELRSIPAAKAVLAGMMFENCPERTSPAVAEAVLQILRGGIASRELVSSGSAIDPPPRPQVTRDLRILKDGLQRFDPERLALRRLTGLEETPEPADADIPPGERVRGLLDELEEDAELCGLVSLTRDLMAALTLPRAISEPDALPQGGVSDLTNRGPLDRLLLSELANDDLTLAVRVATGSALYWRRERPPQPKPRQRSLLLEAGLRSWGLPRVFATAVALAVAATADKHTTLACHRARAGEIAPVDLTTRQGLVEHLAALEPQAHPGAALAAFAKAVEDSGIDTDSVLVLAEDAYADREFQRELAAAAMPPLLVATVSRAGGFTLLARGERGSRVLREAKLDLEKLFRKPKPKPARLLDPSRKQDLPAIMALSPFPLRLPHNCCPQRMGRVEGAGVLDVTRDRRLLLWDQAGLGPRQLADDLPRGTLVWNSWRLVEGRILAVVGRLDNAQLTLLAVRLETSDVERDPLQLRERVYQGMCAHNGVLFAIHRRQIESFDLLTGESRGIIPIIAEYRWKRDRFFAEMFRPVWVALSHDAQAPRFVATLGKWLTGAPDPALALFECAGIDGPIAITPEGHLYFTTDLSRRVINHGLLPPIEVKAISRRGDRILLSGKSGHYIAWKRVDVMTGAVDTAYADPIALVERFNEFVNPMTLRNRFVSVWADPSSRRLTLRSRADKCLALEYDGGRNAIVLRDVNKGCDPKKPVVFAALQREGRHVYQMRCAAWPDGSKVYLDKRGLLHLQSADAAIPEVSIVLKDGPLAGWCADGTLWGQKYFTDVEEDAAAARHVWESAIEPFVRRLS